MSVERRTQSGLLVTLLLLTALAPITMVQAQPTSPSEFYYGVEYDWSSLDDDFSNLSGMDIEELLIEIMADADAAGFNLDVGQLTTGSSNVYVHQTEDITMQTIQDGNGDDIEVWSRTSDVVLRHGILFDGVLLTDWDEAASFGGDNNSFDIDVISQFENVLTVDILYTEYLTDDYNLVGADMDLDLTVSADMSLDVDIALEGGGEEITVDFATGISFGYSMESTDAVWRLDAESPIYIEASDNYETNWNCADDEEEYGVNAYPWGGVAVNDLCGEIGGTYTGAADYEIYFTGLPTEEFGLDSGEFDLTVSDAFAHSGNYDEMFDGEFRFSMEQDMEGNDFEVDLGNGETVDAVACVDCPPGNPVMFTMMGNVLAQSTLSFGEEIAEDLEASFQDSIVDTIFDEWASDLAESNDDGPDEWQCDDGEWIPEWWVNDGFEDCSDGSDESGLVVNSYYSGENVIVYGEINTDKLPDLGVSVFTCDDSDEINWADVNDGTQHCSGGEDEQNQDGTRMFTCNDGTEISWDSINDYDADCSEFEDEGAAAVYHLQVTSSYSDGTVFGLNDYTVCDAHSDYICDFSSPNTYFNADNVFSADSHGPLEYCISAVITTGSGDVMMESHSECGTIWVGHQGALYDLRSDGMTLNWEAQYSNYLSSNDAEMHISVQDDQGNEVFTETSQLMHDGDSEWFQGEFDVSTEGEYCIVMTLIEEGETEAYQTETRCEEVSTEGEPSDRLITILEAFTDSSLQNVAEDFMEQLSTTFEDLEENEIPEFPYSDGMWAPLWSTEHATIIGVGLYAMDDDEEKYVIAGPATTGYSQDLPMTFMSIRYLTGVPAQEAQTEMVDFEDIEDIVDIEDHDLSALEDALEQAGADTSTLDLDQGDGTGDGTSAPDSAVDVAEDSGLLPFLSPLSVLAMVGIAALAGNSRRRETNE
tara:strand:- start:1339 stop:4131 length:2793 start_codon:yes stop_codon:yes gene_type:complete